MPTNMFYNSIFNTVRKTSALGCLINVCTVIRLKKPFQSLLNIQEHSIYCPALHELTISLDQVFCALNFTLHVL